MKVLITIICITVGLGVWAQNVGIGTNTPDASAKLHIDDANRGLLIPNVSLSDVTTASPVTSPATGLLVWNTNASVTGGDGEGYYYWDGTEWKKLTTSDDAWSIDGNSGTDDAQNFMGTTDNQDVVFKRNGTEIMRLNQFDNLTVGSSASFPQARIFADIPSTDAIDDYTGYFQHAGSTSGNAYTLYAVNNCSTNSYKYGLSLNTTNIGTGGRYGIINTVNNNPSSNTFFYGYRFSGTSYGTGTNYGYYGALNLNGGMSGAKYGIFSLVSQSNASGSTMNTYGGYFQNNTLSANSNIAYGLYATGYDYAIYANGNTTATGTKAFSIDHPLDPENKVLKHFAIESNEVLNLYRGVAVLDDSGEAIVELPAYFEEINMNFTYSLTAIGTPVTPYILEEIEGNTFAVKGAPNTKVSWEVKANRNDRYLQEYPESAVSEVEKSELDKGKYLRPELYNQPEEMGIHYQGPEEMPEEEVDNN